MTPDFPDAAAILAVFDDHVEALVLTHKVRRLRARPASRFDRLDEDAFVARLEQDRNELEKWCVLALVASFEATFRQDLRMRVSLRSKDVVRKRLRDLAETSGGRVRFEDLLEVWETSANVGAAHRTNVRLLFRHRNWLAHGRHWTNKLGALPHPYVVRAQLEDYLASLKAAVPDFPRR